MLKTDGNKSKASHVYKDDVSDGKAFELWETVSS